MRLRTIKYAVGVGSLLVWGFVIVTSLCLFNRICFTKRKESKKFIVASWERLSFQTLLDFLGFKESRSDFSRGLNQHIWENNCVKTIETLCIFPIFPNAPDQRQVISRTEITAPKDVATDGHRLFGYVLPNSTGEYQFSLSSNGFAEIWLSLSNNWTAAKQLASIKPYDAQYVTKWNFAPETKISYGIHLKARVKHYIEILYTSGTHGKSENFLRVAWRGPQQSKFKIIDDESLLPFTNDIERGTYKMFDDELPHALPCGTKHQNRYENKNMRRETIPYLEHTAVNKALQYCEYRPSYLLDPANLKGFKRYHGVNHHARKTYSFPLPNVDGIVRKKSALHFSSDFPLDEEEASSAVYKYLDALGKAYPG